MHKVEYVFWPAIVALGEDIDNVTWYTKPSRLTALVKDLCETAGLGFETTGMSLEEAQAAVRKAAPALTLQQRTLTAAQVHQYANPNTATWVDHMTIERLMDSDGGLVPVFQLRQMIPGVWAENQWTGDIFTSAVEAMVPDNAAGRSARGQVAAVRQFLHETAVRYADLAHYIPSGKVEDEIERRRNGDKIDSLVALTWQQAFPVLKKVFATTTPGYSVVRKLKEAATALGLGSTTTMTYEQIKNLCSKLAPSTAALDDNPADVDGNEGRLSRAVESAKSLAAPARQPGAAASVGQGGTATEAQFAEVAGDANYIKLARVMEPFATSIGSGTDEKKKALVALLKDQSAAGVYFVLKPTKTLDSQAPFKSLTGLKTSSGTEVLQQVYNDALSLDGDGKKKQWGLLITAADAAKLVKGHVECNKGSDGVDWWSLLRDTIIWRDGQQAVANVETDETGDPTWIFSNPRAMELMLPPMWEIFKLIGYGSTRTGGFYTTWKNMISRTKQVLDLPPADARSGGVWRSHVEACAEILKAFANEFKAMLNNPLPIAVAGGKPANFYSGDSTAGILWNQVYDDIKVIKNDAEKETRGMSKRYLQEGSPPGDGQAYPYGGQPKWQATEAGQRETPHGWQRQQLLGQKQPWHQLGQADTPEGAAELCNECGEEAKYGAIDPSDGMYYCATCWDAYEPMDTTAYPPPTAAKVADANAARNQRDVATLREIFPGHCAYHLYYHHARGRTGCRRANCNLQHERPDDLDAALIRLEGHARRDSVSVPNRHANETA